MSAISASEYAAYDEKDAETTSKVDTPHDVSTASVQKASDVTAKGVTMETPKFQSEYRKQSK